MIVSSEQSYLSRAMGANPQIEIDYQALPVEQGDVFLLATDGVHEHVGPRFIAKAIGDQCGRSRCRGAGDRRRRPTSTAAPTT